MGMAGMNMGTMMPQMVTFQPTWTAASGVTHLNVTTVGPKTQQSSFGVLFATLLLGTCLIFPLFFMCCMWWRKLITPLYEVNE